MRWLSASRRPEAACSDSCLERRRSPVRRTAASENRTVTSTPAADICPVGSRSHPSGTAPRSSPKVFRSPGVVQQLGGLPIETDVLRRSTLRPRRRGNSRNPGRPRAGGARVPTPAFSTPCRPLRRGRRRRGPQAEVAAHNGTVAHLSGAVGALTRAPSTASLSVVGRRPERGTFLVVCRRLHERGGRPAQRHAGRVPVRPLGRLRPGDSALPDVLPGRARRARRGGRPRRRARRRPHLPRSVRVERANLWWPADRARCGHRHRPDEHYVGGSAVCIAELRATLDSSACPPFRGRQGRRGTLPGVRIDRSPASPRCSSPPPGWSDLADRPSAFDVGPGPAGGPRCGACS